MPQLSCKDLSFSFGADLVLADVNLQCERGGFVSVLGASGCGKSTLLRLIAGLLQPAAGAVLVEPSAATASFVFQQPTLCPWLSVSKNVRLPLELRGISRDEAGHRADEAIQLVDLRPEDGRKLPRQLSGGMQMRASLARALVTQPEIMLMDEPFSALDEVLRQQLSETCLDLWRQESWTTVFVTHNVAEAVFMSQQIYILAGTPSTVVERIDVPFSQRNQDLRVSSDFVAFVSDVSQRLRSAVEQADRTPASTY